MIPNMPVACYQVSEYESEADGNVVAVTTYSLLSQNTNLLQILRLVAPSAEPIGHTGFVFDPSYRYRVNADEMSDALALLKAHSTPVVTAMTDCAVSVCLDFYQHPDESEDAVVWRKTPVGALVHAAKYGGRMKEKGPELAQRVVDYVLAHPFLRSAAGVAAVPSSQSLGVAERGLVAGITKWVARELNVPVVGLARTELTARSQKNLPEGEDPDANQAGTMGAQVPEGGLVLVIDDLMRHGSTIAEANRALTVGGAAKVASLSLVKERTGTRRYQFP